MKRVLCILLTLSLLPLVGACSPAVAPKTGYQSVASQNRIIYIRRDGQHATLSRYLKVVRELSKYDEETGLFTGILVLNNDRYKVKGSPTLVCDVQFVFLDENGLEVEKTNWQPIQFTPGVDVMVKQVSMSPDTRDYKVYVREPKTPGY